VIACSELSLPDLVDSRLDGIPTVGQVEAETLIFVGIFIWFVIEKEKPQPVSLGHAVIDCKGAVETQFG